MKHLVRDAVLFFVLLAIYALNRVILFVAYAPEDTTVTFSWLVRSLRFDLMTAAYFTLPALVLTLVCLFTKFRLTGLKKWYGIFIVLVSIVIVVVNVGFFSEYQSQYNHWVFGIIFDDRKAILSTIWKQYPIVWIILGTSAAIALIAWGFQKLFARTEKLAEPSFMKYLPARAFVALAALFVCVTLMRGGKLSGRPLQARDFVVTNSDFLNGIVPSPAFCLKQEIKKLLTATFAKNGDFKPEELKGFADTLYGDCGSLDLREILKKHTAKAALPQKPSHVFFIIGEGYTAWPTFEDMRHYNLMPQTLRLAKTFPFSNTVLATGGGTMDSTAAFISGIPYCSLPGGAYHKGASDFSPAKFMRQLGYETFFYYGGHMSWHDVGNFAKNNFFQNIVGGEKMSADFGQVEWGVRDAELFDFILAQQRDTASFNLILTVSNHPPFDVDLEKEGCPNPLSDPHDRKLQHHWYADKEIGRFIDSILKKYPDAIVIVTGDHAARIYPKELEFTARMSNLVPLLIAGELATRSELPRTIGAISWMDAIPTLIDLCAPQGFEYAAWGHSLLSKDKPAQAPKNPWGIFYDDQFHTLGSAAPSAQDRELVRAYIALAYWCTRQGPLLPDPQAVK